MSDLLQRAILSRTSTTPPKGLLHDRVTFDLPHTVASQVGGELSGGMVLGEVLVSRPRLRTSDVEPA